MLHLGDITKISGYTAPIVDVVVGGSPCQDLSVAGKRAGLDGERSGLFMEQLRIIKEMRDKDVHDGRSGVDIRPRYMVWENVPGAFSSNKAEDFRIVLEETAKVAAKDAVIPMPPNNKWTTSGCIVGNGWSIAWRVCDAQFYGVPQRRRRIALVADFGGQSAPEILFVRKGVSGHSEQSQPQRENTPTDAARGTGADDRERCFCFEPGIASREGGHIYENVSGTIRAKAGDNQMATAYTMQDREGKAGGGKGALIAEELSATLRAGFAQTLFQPCSWDGGQTSPTLTARNASGCQRMPDKDNFNAVIQPIGVDIYNTTLTGSKPCSLTAEGYTSTGTSPKVIQPIQCIDQGGGKSACNVQEGQAPTLTCTHGGEPAVCYSIENHPMVFKADDGRTSNVAPTIVGDHNNRVTDHTALVVALDRASFNQGQNAKYDFDINDSGICSTIVAKGPGAVAYGFDQGATRDVGSLFLKEQSKTLTNGSCPGHHNGVVVAVDCRNGTEDPVNGALQSNMAHSLNGNNVVRTRYIVRRLTPLECERLQGYPDGWTDIDEWTDSKGKVHKTSDAARYKALGNSIALPPWKWVLKRLCACYERDATLASLFDGIGGFPLIWEQLNGKGSCLWASEIEDFPIAVTKKRIGG